MFCVCHNQVPAATLYVLCLSLLLLDATLPTRDVITPLFSGVGIGVAFYATGSGVGIGGVRSTTGINSTTGIGSNTGV